MAGYRLSPADFERSGSSSRTLHHYNPGTPGLGRSTIIGFRVVRFRVLGFRVQGLGFRVQVAGRLGRVQKHSEL